MTHVRSWTVGIGQSLTDLGTVWPVIEDHGKCGCGQVDMKSTVAYFTDHATAQAYADWQNAPQGDLLAAGAQRARYRYRRLAGLIGCHFMIPSDEAIAIIERRDVQKIRKAWENYTRYKGRVWNWPEVSRVMRTGACRLARMI